MSQAAGNQRRTEDFGIEFADKLATGWAFSVQEAFRDQLDILYLVYVDKEKSKELRKTQPLGEDGKSSKVMRAAWSRGVPPLLRFDAGHIFYDPPAARNMVWGDALKALKRAVQITEAKPDDQPGSGGWVKVKIYHYEAGVVA